MPTVLSTTLNFLFYREKLKSQIHIFHQKPPNEIDAKPTPLSIRHHSFPQSAILCQITYDQMWLAGYVAETQPQKRKECQRPHGVAF